MIFLALVYTAVMKQVWGPVRIYPSPKTRN